MSDLAYTKSEAEHLVAKATGTITGIQDANDGSNDLITEAMTVTRSLKLFQPTHTLKAVGNTFSMEFTDKFGY